MELNLSCELTSINNLKLFSYFMPDKFDMKSLQTSKEICNLVPAFLSFLKQDIHTYNLSCRNDIVNAKLRSENEQTNNFGSLSPMTISYLDIYYNWVKETTQLSFYTEKNREYTDCNIVNLKINPITNKLKCIVCQLTYGNHDYLMYDADNYCIAIVSQENRQVCNRILNRI